MDNSLNIIVCLSQVPAEDYPVHPGVRPGSAQAGDNPEHYRLDLQSEYALELALRLRKETSGATVRAISLGPARTERVLRQALAAGADSAVRIWDDAFDCSDPLAAARILGAAVQSMEFDIVLCGDASEDYGSGCFGAALAAALRVPCLSKIRELQIEPSSKAARVKSKRKNMSLTYNCALPAVFTLAQGRPCPSAPVNRIRWANRAEIPVLDAKALPADVESLKSGVRVERYTHPKPRDKRSLGAPPDLSPHERFARVLYGGISARPDRIIIEGSTSGEAEKLFGWLVREKLFIK